MNLSPAQLAQAALAKLQCPECGAINQPKGVQRPHIPLLIGGGGEQVTLKLVLLFL